MTSPVRYINDDPAFFSRCQRMRQAGLSEELEQPAITRLLPAVSSADALDIGCGDGRLARWLASQGADTVTRGAKQPGPSRKQPSPALRRRL